MGFENRRNRAIAAGALAVGIAGYELTKTSADQQNRSAEIAKSHTPAVLPKKERIHTNLDSGSSNELSEPLTADYETDFTKMHFRTEDLLDLSRVYFPLEHGTEQNSDRYVMSDQLLRQAHEVDHRLGEEYTDIASHLTIEAESDWLHITSPDGYGGFDLSYQIDPPTAEHSQWGITVDDPVGGTHETSYYAAPSGTDTVNDLKERILMDLKARIDAEARKYRLDNSNE